ncbi:MAG: DUF2851 family protein [Endomicrobiia bacterium]
MNRDIYLKIRKEQFKKIDNLVKENFFEENLNEKLISEIWYRQEFDKRNLATIDGKKIFVVSSGERNTFIYSNFSKAKILIDGKEYILDVEVNKNRSDWFKHKHNVSLENNKGILHIFYNFDTKRLIEAKTIFELCLKDRINFENLYLFEDLKETKFKELGLCGDKLSNKDYEYLESLIISAAEARVFLKSEKFFRWFISKQQEEQLLYEQVCEVHGFVNNRDNFLLLAHLVPIKKIRKLVREYSKIKHSEIIESIFFGVGGFYSDLNDKNIVDDYILKLYNFWENKIKRFFSKTLSKDKWKFYKTRPVNYPYRRISALSKTLANFLEFKINNFLTNLLENFSAKEILSHLNNIFYQPAEGYFSKKCSFTSREFYKPVVLFGKEKVSVLIINVIIPYFIYYSRKKKDENLYSKALEIFKNIKSVEKNNIVIKFSKNLIKSKEHRRYFLSKPIFVQGLLQIYKDFCEPINNRCGDCCLPKIIKKDYIINNDFNRLDFIEL